MRWRPARVAWSTSRPSPDYGAGSWGFESLTARHYHRSSADGDEAAGCRQAAGLRPNCDHVGGHSRATATIMAAAGFPLPLSADLEDLASAVTLVHADHHPTGSGSSLRNWAEITSHTCGEASKVGRPQRSRRPDSAPDNRLYHRPPGRTPPRPPAPGPPGQTELSGAGPPLPEIGQGSPAMAASHRRTDPRAAQVLATARPLQPAWLLEDGSRWGDQGVKSRIAGANAGLDGAPHQCPALVIGGLAAAEVDR